MTDFGLEALVSLYVESLSPIAWSRRFKRPLPAFLVYQHVMQELNLDDPRAKKHRERVLGKSALIDAPTDYYNSRMIVEMGISLLEWRAYPIHDRARIIAAQHLKTMMDVIDAHYRELDETMERIEREKGGKGERRFG
jgi:hypothetical protein